MFECSLFCKCILVLFICCIFIYYVQNAITEYYASTDQKLVNIKAKFEKFFSQERYWTGNLSSLNERNIMKELHFLRGEKSYTINKEKVYICMKDEKGEYYDDNMLIYVIAHEISHAICPEIGHTELFHQIFDELLLELIDAGIFDPNEDIIMDYCKDGDPEFNFI